METMNRMLVIGGSAGSLTAALAILPLLKKESMLAVALIFHRKETDDTMLIEVLSKKTLFQVKEVEEKEAIRPHVIYLAPADYHVLIEKDLTFSLDYSEKVNFSRPSIDVTFESAADVFGKSLIGLLLSGGNDDGVKGLLAIQKNGGFVAVQDPKTAEVPTMPQRALDSLLVDMVVSPHAPASFLEILENTAT